MNTLRPIGHVIDGATGRTLCGATIDQLKRVQAAPVVQLQYGNQRGYERKDTLQQFPFNDVCLSCRQRVIVTL